MTIDADQAAAGTAPEAGEGLDAPASESPEPDGGLGPLAELAVRFDLVDGAASALAAHVQLVERNMHLPGDRITAPRLAVDSLYGLELEPVRTAERIADVGSGAGFPGLVLAIALPHARVTLIDRKPNACRFLRRAIETLGLTNVEVVEGRVQDWPEGAGAHDLVTSRKMGRPGTLADWIAPLVAPGGSVVIWQQGPRDFAKEAQARTAADTAGLRAEQVRRTAEKPQRHLFLYRKVREVAPPEAETEPADQPAKPVVKRSVKKPGRGTRGAGQRETLPDDAVAEAKDALVRALDAIDAEIETAEDVANKARADYEALRASAAERKAVIQAKIDALELAGTGETTSNAGANKRPRWRGLRAQ